MVKTSEKTKASAVKKAAKGKQKAEKIFHPESRKAGQMQREALRKTKLSNQVVKRGKKQMNLGMFPSDKMAPTETKLFVCLLKQPTDTRSLFMHYHQMQLA